MTCVHSRIWNGQTALQRKESGRIPYGEREKATERASMASASASAKTVR